MERKALSDKILCLGIDGLDPRFTKHLIDQGKLPNLKKFVEVGACREDLSMLGGHPTITPPMWTTLATGCYANVHGITDFSRRGSRIDAIAYNMDSRNCHAEQIWNCFAEAGKKTLVMHWPGSSWPPSSDSENLFVIDGTTPAGVYDSTAKVDDEYLVGASEEIETITYATKVAKNVNACVVDDLDVDEKVASKKIGGMQIGMNENINLILDETEGLMHLTEGALDMSRSSIKPASGWTAAPADAKEFTMLMSGGLVRRTCLILKNEQGIYDKVAIYKNKKEVEPLAVLEQGKIVEYIFDEAIRNEQKVPAYRNMRLLQLAEDGSKLKIWVSCAYNPAVDSVFSPKRLHKMLTESIGYPAPVPRFGSHDEEMITKCLLPEWKLVGDWQANAIHEMIATENIEVVFSHYHCVDLQIHNLIRFAMDKGYNTMDPGKYVQFMEMVYENTDNYLGKFMHFLDEGWSILIMSDHALVCSAHDFQFLGDCTGVSINIMEELGLTAVKHDADGNRLHEIDWEKTIAVAQGSSHIYVNLRGRDEFGIVEPADKYEVEDEIITRLYGYRDKKTGKRIISLAVRNKDAVHFGLGGPESGDIIYFLEEGYQWDHGDSLSTSLGEENTSVAPIFIAAGKGFKRGFYTDRIIRQIDFAPTVAMLGGVRYPVQCEGAPVYQIFEKEI